MSGTRQFVARRGDGLLPHNDDKLDCAGDSCAACKLPTTVPAILLMGLLLLGVTPLFSTIASSSPAAAAKKTLRVMTYKIVVGDLNDEPSGKTYQLMCQGFEDAWVRSRAKGAGLTYPADKPVKRIDYVFTRQSDRVKVKKAWVVNTLASDHLPLVADLELR